MFLKKEEKTTSYVLDQFSSVAQSCPTLGNPVDNTVHGILHARMLAWVKEVNSPTVFSSPLVFCRKVEEMLMILNQPKAALEFCLGILKLLTGQCSTFHTLVHLSFNTVCVLSCLSCVRLFATIWTVAHQAPLSIGFSRQEYWSR